MPKHDQKQQGLGATAPAFPPTPAAATEAESSTAATATPAAASGVSASVQAHRDRTIAQAARMAEVPSVKIAPRFGPGRQVAEPAEADPELGKEGLLVLHGTVRCARQDCGGGMPMPDSKDLLARSLDTLGWQKFRGKWFCSKMCVSNETTSPAATLGHVEARSSDRVLRATPRELVAKDGHVKCERPDCGARVPVHGMKPAQMVAAAIAHGFVQTPDGVFCCHEHAREVVRGARAALTG